MTNPLPTYLRIESALKAFVLAPITQDQGHIKPLHKYVSLRSVIEAGSCLKRLRLILLSLPPAREKVLCWHLISV